MALDLKKPIDVSVDLDTTQYTTVPTNIVLEDKKVNSFTISLVKGTTAVDVTGLTVQLQFNYPTNTVTVVDATVTDASTGKISYSLDDAAATIQRRGTTKVNVIVKGTGGVVANYHGFAFKSVNI